MLAHELASGSTSRVALSPDVVFKAVAGVHRHCVGAYAVVALVVGCGLLGFRDPRGIRPLVYGKRESQGRTEYMIASESVALDMLGFSLQRDLRPGEAIWVDQSGTLHTKMCVDESYQAEMTPCIFELVYLARPDSIIDDISVYRARLRMGEKLAERIMAVHPDAVGEIDVVIPIPESARTAALSLGAEAGSQVP